MDPISGKWSWYWRVTDGEADCGIFVETRPGHAYAICRCPRYVKESEWSTYASHICDLHNATIST